MTSTDLFNQTVVFSVLNASSNAGKHTVSHVPTNLLAARSFPRLFTNFDLSLHSNEHFSLEYCETLPYK